MEAQHFYVQFVYCAIIWQATCSRRFINPEVKLVGNLAIVWTRNEVTLDGEVVIEGMHALSLHEIDGKWKISSIFDAAE